MPVMREQRALQRLNGPRSVQCYDTVGSQGCHAEYQVDLGDKRGHRIVGADCIRLKKD